MGAVSAVLAVGRAGAVPAVHGARSVPVVHGVRPVPVVCAVRRRTAGRHRPALTRPGAVRAAGGFEGAEATEAAGVPVVRVAAGA
ncbi:hypothetical protein, partial [Streptomyces clavuligerus]|uniref:hypothetical protein n=1 Tax=Streptomyces clavuligerus TaxID=1901 RepID=UPI001E33307F